MESKGNSSLIMTLLVVAAVVIIGFLVWAMVDDNDGVVTTTDDTTTQQEETESQLEMVVENPAAYYEQQLTLEGEIQDLYTNRLFSISDDTIGDELLVVTRSALSDEQAEEAEEFFEDNANVTVAGTLRELVVADVEADYGIDLNEEIETEFAAHPVFIAETITFNDSGQLFEYNLDTDTETGTDTE